MAKNDKSGLRRLAAASGYSAAGLRAAWRGEEAFRQEVLLAVLLAPVGLWLGETMLQRALLVGTLFLMLAIELLNSALEAVVDRIGHEYHALSGQAKDMGSAAVLFSLIASGTLWAGIAWDRFSR